MLKEFKDFVLRGNVIDLAVAVIIAAAFGKIIASLVNDIIMPMIGVLLGGVNFSTLSVMVGEASIAYGLFIQAIIDFLIIGLVLFIIIKLVNRASRAKAAAPAAPPEDVILLGEIRDLLKKQAK